MHVTVFAKDDFFQVGEIHQVLHGGEVIIEFQGFHVIYLAFPSGTVLLQHQLGEFRRPQAFIYIQFLVLEFDLVHAFREPSFPLDGDRAVEIDSRPFFFRQQEHVIAVDRHQHHAIIIEVYRIGHVRFHVPGARLALPCLVVAEFQFLDVFIVLVEDDCQLVAHAAESGDATGEGAKVLVGFRVGTPVLFFNQGFRAVGGLVAHPHRVNGIDQIFNENGVHQILRVDRFRTLDITDFRGLLVFGLPGDFYPFDAGIDVVFPDDLQAFPAGFHLYVRTFAQVADHAALGVLVVRFLQGLAASPGEEGGKQSNRII